MRSITSPVFARRIKCNLVSRAMHHWSKSVHVKLHIAFRYTTFAHSSSVLNPRSSYNVHDDRLSLSCCPLMTKCQSTIHCARSGHCSSSWSWSLGLGMRVHFMNIVYGVHRTFRDCRLLHAGASHSPEHLNSHSLLIRQFIRHCHPRATLKQWHYPHTYRPSFTNNWNYCGQTKIVFWMKCTRRMFTQFSLPYFELESSLCRRQRGRGRVKHSIRWA